MLDRVRDHSKAHADVLLKSTLFTRFYKEAKANLPGQKERLYAHNLSIIQTSAPEEGDGMRFGDIKIRDEWRSGLDKVFPEQRLETLVPSLISRELDDSNVFARTIPADGSRRLVAACALKEGDVLMQASCLLFTDIAKVTEFLNTGGNSALLQGPVVRMDGLLDDTGSPRTIFAVMVGAAMFIGDYRSGGGRPNVALVVKPCAGANHGILEYVVKTRTGRVF